MIVVVADYSESLYGNQERPFKRACKRPEPGASRNPSNCKLNVEWRSAPEKKIEPKLSKRNFRNMYLLMVGRYRQADFEMSTAAARRWTFSALFWKSQTSYLIDVPKVRFRFLQARSCRSLARNLHSSGYTQSTCSQGGGPCEGFEKRWRTTTTSVRGV